MRVWIWLLCCAGLAAQTTPAPSGKLIVDGDVASPFSISTGELAKMPHQTVTMTEMGGAKASYEGVPLADILAKAGLPFGKELRGKTLASYLLVEARDGYQVVFSLGEIDAGVGSTRVIVADRSDGKPLTERQGPIRLVVTSDQRPARSVRMLEKIHVVQLRK
jgi:DMSO/TMAO reductase YedYZ molybdopterin-dependent catalytic subunit